MRLGTCSLYLARSASLREAADVLRTYRRAAGEKRKRRSKWQGVGIAFLKALCDEMRGVAKLTSKEFESLSKLSLGRPQTL